MRYLETKFSVGSPGTQAYADAWDRIFKRAELQDPKGGGAEAPTGEGSYAPTADGCVCGANRSDSFEGVHAGGCVAMGRGEGRGYQIATPSNDNEGGVSGFPEGGQ